MCAAISLGPQERSKLGLLGLFRHLRARLQREMGGPEALTRSRIPRFDPHSPRNRSLDSDLYSTPTPTVDESVRKRPVARPKDLLRRRLEPRCPPVDSRQPHVLFDARTSRRESFVGGGATSS